eukprot:CAMPEP_0198208838 /NCGR_PEP_ID=MMETSP1445-20131203/12181_1 /TAXON_ID=36898 /ORGANISM="Pyramimonas sp., Strain CCMP2087" /LENGTH=212 /DNA_ID=CAMNT_0043882395 /DNA_START=29 /DNA_END=667 /DNA_ORIENTATION=+
MTADESSPRRRTERDKKPVKLFTPDQLPNNVGGKRRGRKIMCKGKLMDLNSPRIEKNEYIKVRTKAASQMSTLRREQLFLDAYAADGWKGSSGDRVQLTSEVVRAKASVLRCKLAIRNCFKELDYANGDRAIEVDEEDDEIDDDKIFCAKCEGLECEGDNDILLCDGSCNRAYHQRCLTPHLLTADIPEGDEGWLCPSCDMKATCIDMLNVP